MKIFYHCEIMQRFSHNSYTFQLNLFLNKLCLNLWEKCNKNKNNWIKIEDIKNNGSLEISIAIIINRNITVKNLSNEIFETINFYFKNKKQEYLLKKLNIYNMQWILYI